MNWWRRMCTGARVRVRAFAADCGPRPCRRSHRCHAQILFRETRPFGGKEKGIRRIHLQAKRIYASAVELRAEQPVAEAQQVLVLYEGLRLARRALTGLLAVFEAFFLARETIWLPVGVEARALLGRVAEETAVQAEGGDPAARTLLDVEQVAGQDHRLRLRQPLAARVGHGHGRLHGVDGLAVRGHSPDRWPVGHGIGIAVVVEHGLQDVAGRVEGVDVDPSVELGAGIEEGARRRAGAGRRTGEVQVARAGSADGARRERIRQLSGRVDVVRHDPVVAALRDVQPVLPRGEQEVTRYP